MTKHNVMVFPCGSEIGLEINRSVRHSTHFELFGASSTTDHGSVAYERYIGDLPFIDDPRFPSAINQAIRENNIDLIVPAHDSAVLALAELAGEGELACTMVGSSLRACILARSKRATYDHFSNLLPTPEVYRSPHTAVYPAFVKPDVGQGSKDAIIVHTAEHASAILSDEPSKLIIEYLPGAEYTIDCFTDRNRIMLYCEGRIRSRISHGISVRSERVRDKRFRELAEIINETVSLRGAWFFQVKERADGELVLLEFAPRVAGTMGLSRAYGANLPLLSLFDALELPVSICCNDFDLVIDRALQSSYVHALQFDRVYLDFDDTVIVRGQINTALMAFVFQCKNKGVPVSLLTRHAADLQESLRRLGMETLFEEIVWLKNGEPKAAHIASSRAILIDDSWAERANVQQVCGIPVFDTHMIDVLLEGI